MWYHEIIGEEFKERAFNCGCEFGESQNEFALAWEEMASLAEACEMEVVGRIQQNRSV